MANGFNPLASFLSGQKGAIDVKQRRLDLQQAQADAPRRNALADLKLEQTRQQVGAGQRQTGITQESERVQFMNRAGKALLQLAPEQREQAFARLEPLAERVGIQPGTFTPERLTDESLNQLISTTEGFIRDPQLLEQQKLNLRERELEQRGQLLRDEPRRKGDIEREKLLAQKTLKAEVAGEVASSQVRSKEIEQRGQDIITKGLTAADGTSVLRRGIQLLNGIETGGIDKVQLAAKNFFGIESADEGELSNLLGKAVLSQLRETFGAAFTAKEGDSLKTIDANIGKSPAANRRLLQNALRIAERAAQRGIDRAVEAKDFKTAQEIQESLDFVLEELPGPAVTAPGAQQSPPVQQAPAQQQAPAGVTFLGFE